jgi:iron complex transport system substrate-binding protein
MTGAIIALSAALLVAGGCRRAPVVPGAASGPRVVSLAPNLTEIACAVGGARRLVGRTDVCNYPPETTANIPIIGSFGRPFMETLLTQHPTAVIEVDLEDKTIADLFTRLGIAHHRIACQRLADIPPAIRAVGRVVNCQARADTLAETVASGLAARQAALAATPATNRPLVFVAVWWDPLMTVGRNAFISEVVTLAGGRNLGDELPRDYGTVSLEWVLERNPDVIVSLSPGTPGTTQARLAGRAGWCDVRAVRNGRVLDAFDLDVLSRPGPRVLAGIDQLRQALAAGDRQAGAP